MRIGILGSGDVAKSLGNGFLAAGHEVMLGSRQPEKLSEWKQQSPGGQTGTFEQCAQFGEAIVLATLGVKTQDAINDAGPANFTGKVVIDATNPLDFSSGGPALAWGFNDSNGERVQKQLPNSAVVKAFNTVGNALFYKPQLPGGPPTMFICGNDHGAKQTVRQILDSFGWETADVGDIRSSRYLEAMCIAWVLYGVVNNDWSGHAFKLLHGR